MTDNKLSMKRLKDELQDLDKVKADRSDVALMDERLDRTEKDISDLMNGTPTMTYVDDKAGEVRAWTQEMLESAGAAMQENAEATAQVATGLRDLSDRQARIQEARDLEIKEMREWMAKVEKRMVRVEDLPKPDLKEDPDFQKLSKETLRERNAMVVIGSVALGLSAGAILFCLALSLI